MSKTLAGVDRLILALLGIVLIALGVWPILIHFNVEFATYLAKWVDHDTWAGLPHQSWWVYALGAATIVLALLGLWLIISNLRHHLIHRPTVEVRIADNLQRQLVLRAVPLDRLQRVVSVSSDSFVHTQQDQIETPVVAVVQSLED